MPRNVEIKARCSDSEEMASRAVEISDSLGTILVQTDTFFHCPQARLKLRVIDHNPDGELIHYRRANQKGPKTSEFTRTIVSNASELVEVLGAAYGVLGVVKKTRRLFLAERTRIHVDEVENLGSFVELEVVMGEDEPEEDGVALASELMTKLGIEEADLMEGAYMDLLLSSPALSHNTSAPNLIDHNHAPT